MTFLLAVYTALPFFQRKVIAKLKCSSQNLENEQGRHKGRNAHARTCQSCTENVNEDQMHFLCEFISITHSDQDTVIKKNTFKIMNDKNNKGNSNQIQFFSWYFTLLLCPVLIIFLNFLDYHFFL